MAGVDPPGQQQGKRLLGATVSIESGHHYQYAHGGDTFTACRRDRVLQCRRATRCGSTLPVSYLSLTEQR